ncbi:hypothetical protein [Microbacterium protaetiae]|uniref:hypothetical protein n=1 Tax=Microbacterium protaetiae TaxID=2509458 RepID=UPI001F5D59E5|nr:hypothetical protein [Microbacterium protaetiae]
MSQNPFKGARKTPHAVLAADVVRVPKAATPVPSDENQRKVRFLFDLVDHDGDWSLLDISKEDHSRLLDVMAQVEQMTAGELFKPGQRLCKTYSDMAACPNSKATDRLVNRYEGLDHMVRLEIDGVKRLYGVRAGHEFHIIWWDPKHEVWPSKLHNT